MSVRHPAWPPVRLPFRIVRGTRSPVGLGGGTRLLIGLGGRPDSCGARHISLVVCDGEGFDGRDLALHTLGAHSIVRFQWGDTS